MLSLYLYFVCPEPGRKGPSQQPETILPRCSVKSDKFIMYYFTLLFLLCFATPVLITTSLNVYITSVVFYNVDINAHQHSQYSENVYFPC